MIEPEVTSNDAVGKSTPQVLFEVDENNPDEVDVKTVVPRTLLFGCALFAVWVCSVATLYSVFTRIFGWYAIIAVGISLFLSFYPWICFGMIVFPFFYFRFSETLRAHLRLHPLVYLTIAGAVVGGVWGGPVWREQSLRELQRGTSPLQFLGDRYWSFTAFIAAGVVGGAVVLMAYKAVQLVAKQIGAWRREHS